MAITTVLGRREKSQDDQFLRFRVPTVGVSALADGTFRLVSARELHRVMGMKKAFSAWMEYQINRLALQEGNDYLRAPLLGVYGQVDARGDEVYLHPSVAIQIALLWRGSGSPILAD